MYLDVSTRFFSVAWAFFIAFAKKMVYLKIPHTMKEKTKRTPTKLMQYILYVNKQRMSSDKREEAKTI